MKKPGTGILYFLTSCLVASGLLTSCFKEDEPVTPHEPGTAQSDTIPMTYNYKYQVYFSLSSGNLVSRNIKTATDLGFDCTPQGWKIILNTADFMRAADMGEVPFGQPYDTAGLRWRFDKSDGNPDSLAFGVWYRIAGGDTLSNGHVYAIDRGFDENAAHLGFYQVIFDSLAGGKYYFRFAKADGSGMAAGVVEKDRSVNHAWFSLGTGSAVPGAEPAKEDYDLLFTQYTTLLFTDAGEPYPYLVTGVLSNPDGIVVAIDTAQEFNAITLSGVQSLSYSSSLDAIGYEWKSYDFESGAYTVKSDVNYIIRHGTGRYFKMRFTGFYNSSGEKGYPVIEHQEL